jgi:arylsulfatase A-like enzyme
MDAAEIRNMVNRREFLTLLSAAAAAMGADLAFGAEDERPPNIILIMGDDCSAGEIGCYGNERHRTPHLDRMAEEGVKFETCWCTPLCSPTRAEIMTGRYGFRTRWYHNLMKVQEPLTQRSTIFSQFLKEAGYATAVSGKWQLIGMPPEYGFDESYIWAYENYLPEGVKHTGLYERPGKPERYWHPCILRNGKYVETKPDDYGPDLFSDFVIDFAKRNHDRPFFAYYPMTLTHGPFYPTPDSLQPGQKKQANNMDENFGANIEYMDKVVGKIVNSLEDMGLGRRTVVLFTTDNGTATRGKGSDTERGCRVPLIAYAPGIVKPLGSCPELVDFSDILPTLLDFAGTKVPGDYVIDGRSFAPLLRGEEYEPREWIFSYLADSRMLRDKRWLLEGDGTFYDCGDSRDGTGYKDVTDSDDPEVVAARKRFDEILADLPAPGPEDPLLVEFRNRKRPGRPQPKKQPQAEKAEE